MMRFRKLRIAWSVGWGFAAVLLIALWVRSHYRMDVVDASNWYETDSVYGEILIMNYDPAICLGDPWSYFQFAASDLGFSEVSSDSTLGFKLSESPSGKANLFPHWFPTLISSTLASVPWLH
jgi:hypothetical protein